MTFHLAAVHDWLYPCLAYLAAWINNYLLHSWFTGHLTEAKPMHCAQSSIRLRQFNFWCRNHKLSYIWKNLSETAWLFGWILMWNIWQVWNESNKDYLIYIFDQIQAFWTRWSVALRWPYENRDYNIIITNIMNILMILQSCH